MSDVTFFEMEEGAHEEVPPLKGEEVDAQAVIFLPAKEQVIRDKKLSFEDASKSLCHLGKDESGIRYAYLMIDVQDRKLTDISVVLNFKHVLFLDVSGNYLTLDALQVLVDMPFLIFIKAERNRIDSAALGYMPYLQVLCFNKNHITETCDINQPMLDCLELHNNMICMAQFDIERLKSLKQLELRGNHLMDISGSYPRNIEKLYLADNKISFINEHDLSHLTKLHTLHLRDNLIKKLKGFSENLENLRYLNLRNNKITKMREFRKLQCLKNLETLIIKGNPVFPEEIVATEEKADVGDEELGEGEEDNLKVAIDPKRIALLVLLPSLKRINKEIVRESERVLMMEVRDEKYKEIMDELSSDEEMDIPSTTEQTTEVATSYVEEQSDEEEIEDTSPGETEAEDDDEEGESEEEY